MRVLRAFAILITMTVVSNGQQGTSGISGKVTDASGAALQGVEVTIAGAESGNPLRAITDDKGKYAFLSLPPGKYVISAAIGSEGRLLTADPLEAIVSEGVVGEANLTVMLSASIREQVNVTISAGSVQPISHVSKSINVIGSEELEDRNEISLADALRSIPGFRVQQLGGFGRAASVKTRGLRNQDTAILIDGMRFRDAASITGDASPFISDISVAGVERIEVLRGTGSSVYGTNAMGGVVDFQTAEPRKGLHGNVDGQYGALGLKRLRGALSLAGSNAGFSSSFTRTVYSEGIDGEDDALNNGFLSRIDLDPFRGTSITGRLFLSNASVRLNSGPDTFGDFVGTGIVNARAGVNFLPDANDPDSLQKSGYFSGQISLTQMIKPDLVLRATLQVLRTGRENSNGPQGPGFQPFGGDEVSIFDGGVDTLNARLDWNQTGSSRLTAGYEYESESYGNEGFGPFSGSDFFARSGQKSNTFFAQQLAGFFGSRLQVAGGFRAQMFSVGSTSFSVGNAPYADLRISDPPTAYTADVAAAYYFRSNGTKLRVHVGNGYRVPSLYERLGTFYSSFSQEFTALGDPELKPERSVAIDAGIEQELGGRSGFSATIFYTVLTDTIGFGFPSTDIGTTPRPFGGYRNEKGGIARGVELSFRSEPGRTTYLFASYTYLNSDQRVPQVAGSGINRTLGTPDHQLTFVGTQRLGKDLTINFDLLVSSSYLAPIFSNQTFSSVIYRFGGNMRGDLTARYGIPIFGERARISVFGTLQNLFDDDYYENGFRTEGRNGRFGVGIRF